jgi:hypothetical protein
MPHTTCDVLLWYSLSAPSAGKNNGFDGSILFVARECDGDSKVLALE